jgi:prevent-host-death family protein
MTITVTEFKAHCLRILREVERSNRPVEISKQGRVRYRIVPVREPDMAPWMRLRSHGLLTASAGEAVLSDSDWEASR